MRKHNKKNAIFVANLKNEASIAPFSTIQGETMKLFKLSLAAVFALGVANAEVALTDAIEDVRVGGYLKYTYSGEHEKKKQAGKVTSKSRTQPKHGMDAELRMSVPIDEAFSVYGRIGMKAESPAYAKTEKDKLTATTAPIPGSEIKIKDLYFQYKIEDADTTIKLGRFTKGNLVMGGGLMTGLIATYNNRDLGINSSFFMVDHSEANVRMHTVESIAGMSEPNRRNVFGFDFAYKAEDIGTAKFAVNYVNKYAAFYGIAFDGNVKVSDELSIIAKTQFAIAAAARDVKNKKKFEANKKPVYEKRAKHEYKGSRFFGIELGADYDAGDFGIDASAGFVTYGNKRTQTGAVSAHGNGGLLEFRSIGPGDFESARYNTFSGRNTVWFIGAGGKVSDFNFALDYAHLKKKDAQNTGYSAWMLKPSVGYKYSRKVRFDAEYSFYGQKSVTGVKTSKRGFELSGKYSF